VTRARVFYDANAGAWCWQLPHRLPVQADSWAAAVTTLLDRGQPAPLSPAAPAPLPRRRRWLGLVW
jgi:hypothetical protein